MIRLLLVLLLVSLSACQSVKKSNRFMAEKIPAEKLRADVDFSYQKLKRYHPNLYWYISKEDLDYKFDSLKTTIQKPLTPNEFYFVLAPVIASIGEGHLRLRSYPKRYSKAEEKALKKKNPLFAQMEYKVLGNRLFVTENKHHIGNILPGSEILKINEDYVADLIEKYNRLYSSDGKNKTFQKYFINLTFFSFYTLEKGYLDSASLLVKKDNTISNIKIIRTKKSDNDLKKEEEKPKISELQKVKDFNPKANTYNRDFKFINADSSIAYIRIKSFSANYAKKFYKTSFQKIKNANSDYLILDIRDNLGGSLSEINTLYSYLADKEFRLIKAPEMTSRTSGMSQNYFRGQNAFSAVLTAAGYPFFLAGNFFLSTKKEQHYYFRDFNSRPAKPQKNAFKGSLYVLVNGASFSASSIIAAKLKFEKRALIIGEETGGANDGTVAGVNNTVTLPNSKLTLPIGLFLIRPNITFENKSRGVTPDFYVDPDFENLKTSDDKTLKWVLDDISFRNTVIKNN